MSDEKLSEETQKEVEGLEPTLERLYGIIPLTTAIVTNHMRPILARLEREKERWRRAIEGLTPSGSEFYNDPEYCAEYIRKRTQYPKMIIELREQMARLERERDAALAALEEVEWIESEYDGRMYSSCPWCYVNDLCDGGLVHAKNCSRQAALTATPASTGGTPR